MTASPPSETNPQKRKNYTNPPHNANDDPLNPFAPVRSKIDKAAVPKPGKMWQALLDARDKEKRYQRIKKKHI
jgi:hypothetical protein